MISPYDWQQSVTQRAQYIESRLRGGSPIVAISIEAGTLIYTYRRQVRKVYEVYDCLMFSAMGQQVDVENMRLAAVDFAHQEGFARSEADVTIGRVVGFALSSPMKRAFGDITSAPLVVLAVFAEMNQSPDEDLFFKLRYDGDFGIYKQFAAAAGTPEAEDRMVTALAERYRVDLTVAEAQALADDVWRIGADVDGNGEPDPSLTNNARPESGFLDRHSAHQSKFRLLR
jgi:proteasome alpha subunit